MKKKQKSKKPNIFRTPSKPRARAPRDDYEDRDADAMLEEFSDGENAFFVDEVGEPEAYPEEEFAPRRGSDRSARRKPVSPLKRKLIRIFGTVAIVAVILIIGVVLSLTVLFKTQNYQITGNTLYLDSDIISTCGIDKGENIFLAAKRPAEERIVKRFPYVEAAHVGFSIPDTIKIDITEAAEGYLYKVSDTEYLIISTKGRVLNRIADQSGYRLPIFLGPKLASGEIGDYVSYEDESVLAIIDSITQVFADNGYTGITEVDATDPANITFTYDGRIKVKLGVPEDISYKIRTAMTIINGNIDVNPANKPTGRLDVSRCNVTKRSYFSEGDIAPTELSTQPPAEKATETGSDSSDWTDDGDNWSEDSWSQDDYEWTDDSYSDDGE